MPPWLANPALPKLEEGERIGEGAVRLVEQAIAETAAEDRPRQRDPGDVIDDGIAAHPEKAPARLPAQPDEENVKAGQVGEAVETNAPTPEVGHEGNVGNRVLDEIGEGMHDGQAATLSPGGPGVSMFGCPAQGRPPRIGLAPFLSGP